MKIWIKELKYDPIKPLIDSKNEAIIYFINRDLLNKKVKKINYIWNLPEIKKIFDKQQPDGSWKFKGKLIHSFPPHHYPMVATFKTFRTLVNKYELKKENIYCKKAAEYLFSCQTSKGDFRGMIGNQYATYYTGEFLSLLIKAGYIDDKRIEKGFRWLISMKQNDGGWTIPILTHDFDGKTSYKLTSEDVKPVEPDFTKPFSHNWTDMVLRAFAVHPKYKDSKDAQIAGKLLKSRFFKKDFYSSYKSESYWTRFVHWWPNILTSLESLSNLGFKKEDSDINNGLNWFIKNQQKNGLWKLENAPGKKVKKTQKYIDEQLWLSLRICRLFNRLFE
jgi:hypothetical protein